MGSPYSIRSGPHLHPSSASIGRTNGETIKRPRQSRIPFLAPRSHQTENDDMLSHENSRPYTGTPTRRKEQWWRVKVFRGIVNDIRRRAPFYWSDWRDAWDYRVVPATVYMYFANILPALAFSLDMFSKTAMSYGVNEVLLASVLGSTVFSIFAAQPLVIVGVTGPITVFNYTVYDIITPRGTNYLAFMCWIGLWSLLMHWALAITNACNALTYVTRFSCDIFGFYVAFIYLQKGIQVLTRQWGSTGDTAAYLSIVVALLVLSSGYICGIIGSSKLFQRYIRKFIEDYGTPLTIIFFTGFVHIGRMKTVDLATLPTSKAFHPTQPRSWFIPFWDLSVSDIFLAIPFALLLTILFYFDHNVSSLIAQGTEFPLRKPAGFHWDLFLLGLTTGVAGLLGLPFPNGLIPQAPFHTTSLCATRRQHPPPTSPTTTNSKPHTPRPIDHVVEQRLSNLAQGLLTLTTMSPPLLTVLHLIPQAVLAGLFFLMGAQALAANGLTLKLLFLFHDRTLPSPSPLSRLPRPRAIWAFVCLALAGFAATFAITQTIAAIGFPVIILALVPVRAFLMPRWFSGEELGVLDAPTASPFTMVSVGGNFGEGGDGEGGGGVGVEGVRDVGGEGGEGALMELGESAALERGEAAVVQRRGGGGDEVEMERLSGGSRNRGVSRRSGSRGGRG